MGNSLNQVDKARIRRASFDLSNSTIFPQEFGKLYPLPPIECIPGDVFKLGLSAFIRAQPMVRPVLNRVKCRTYTFFVPYRILWDKWEEFISGPESYDEDVPYVPPILPTVVPYDPLLSFVPNCMGIGSLWDCFGFPQSMVNSSFVLTAENRNPMIMPFQAYWTIWNEYFRFPGLQPKAVPIWYPMPNTGYDWQYNLAYKNHTIDYYTGALPWTQLGVAPALPIFGTAYIESDLPMTAISSALPGGGGGFLLASSTNTGEPNPGELGIGAIGSPNVYGTGSFGGVIAKENFDAAFSAGLTVSGGTLAGADINDLRFLWATQAFLERNARGGARYSEQLRNHFRVNPGDDRLQRPEFIGGTTFDILFSEIPQTGATDTTPQGNLVGHGVGADSSRVGNYRVVEHGLIMTLVCLEADKLYQKGIARSFMRFNQLDFPFPEFVGLGEQEIFGYEVHANLPGGTDIEPFEPWGYTGRYNELRYLPNTVHGLCRAEQNMREWVMSRIISGPDVVPLALSSAFISTAIDSTKQRGWMTPFVVQDPSVTPPFIAHYSRMIHAYRPIPFMAVPTEMI